MKWLLLQIAGYYALYTILLAQIYFREPVLTVKFWYVLTKMDLYGFLHSEGTGLEWMDNVPPHNNNANKLAI